MQTVSNLDIGKIFECLPHRYPFLLIDRVVDYVPGQEIKGYKNVTINEPFFQGHFPGLPVMPGVLIAEAMAQCGGILTLLDELEKNPESRKVFLLTGMDGVRFRRPVVPGDRLDMHVFDVKRKLGMVKMSAKGTVDDKLVCSGTMSAVYTEPQSV